MTEHPYKPWAREFALSVQFLDICEESYVQYIDLQRTLDQRLEEIRTAGEDHEYFEDVELMETRLTSLGIKSIVFAAMTAEAVIYDYAAIYLGDGFVKAHLDKLDLVSKWVLVPRLVGGKSIRKNGLAYERLKKLASARNRLIHHKSVPFSFDEAAHAERLKRQARFEEEVDNSYRALVFLALEMESLFGPEANPMIGVSPNVERSPEPSTEVATIQGECRALFERSNPLPRS